MQCRWYCCQNRHDPDECAPRRRVACDVFMQRLIVALQVFTVVFIVLTVLYATHLQSPEKLQVLSNLFGTNFCDTSSEDIQSISELRVDRNENSNPTRNRPGSECIRLAVEKDRVQRSYDIARYALQPVRVVVTDVHTDGGEDDMNKIYPSTSEETEQFIQQKSMRVTTTLEAFEYLRSLIQVRQPSCTFARVNTAENLIPPDAKSQFALVSYQELAMHSGNLTWDNLFHKKTPEDILREVASRRSSVLEQYNMYEWQCEQRLGGQRYSTPGERYYDPALLEKAEVERLVSLLNWTVVVNTTGMVPNPTTSSTYPVLIRHTPPSPLPSPPPSSSSSSRREKWLFFAHGNSGDYKQVRSLAEHIRAHEVKKSARRVLQEGIARYATRTRQDRSSPLQSSAPPPHTGSHVTRIFTADFREEANIHRGKLVLAQSSFIARNILRQYHTRWIRKEVARQVEETQNLNAPRGSLPPIESPAIWIVGHSMGGIVARMAALLIHTWTNRALMDEWKRFEDIGRDLKNNSILGITGLQCGLTTILHCQRHRNTSNSLCCSHMLRYALHGNDTLVNVRDALPVWIPHMRIGGVVSINSPHRVPVIFMDRWMVGIFRALNNGKLPLARSAQRGDVHLKTVVQLDEPYEEAVAWLQSRVPYETEITWGTSPQLVFPQPLPELSAPLINGDKGDFDTLGQEDVIFSSDVKYISYNSGPRDLQVMYRLTKLCGFSCGALAGGREGAQHISTVSRHGCRSSLGHNEVLYDDCLQTHLARMLSNHMHDSLEEYSVSHGNYSYTTISDTRIDTESRDADSSLMQPLREMEWSPFSLFPVKMAMELHTWVTMVSSIVVTLLLTLVHPTHTRASTTKRGVAVSSLVTGLCIQYSGLLFTFLLCHIRSLQWIASGLDLFQMLGHSLTEYCALPWIDMYIRALEFSSWNDSAHFIVVLVSATGPMIVGWWMAAVLVEVMHFLGRWRAKVHSRASNPVARSLVAYSLLLILEYGILRPTLIYRTILFMAFCVFLRTIACLDEKPTSDVDVAHFQLLDGTRELQSSAYSNSSNKRDGVVPVLVFSSVFFLQMQPFFTIRNEFASRTTDRMTESVDPQWIAVEMMQHTLLLFAMHALHSKYAARCWRLGRMSPFLLLGVLLGVCTIYMSVFVLAAAPSPPQPPYPLLHALTPVVVVLCLVLVVLAVRFKASIPIRRACVKPLQFRKFFVLLNRARRWSALLLGRRTQFPVHSEANTFRPSVVVSIEPEAKPTGTLPHKERSQDMMMMMKRVSERVYHAFLMYFLACVMAGNPAEVHSNASVGLLLISPLLVHRMLPGYSL